MILRRFGRQLAGKFVRVTGRGLSFLPCGTPIRTMTYPAGGVAGRLIIFLPGIGDFAEDFQGQGFVECLRASGLCADAVAVDAHFGYYARGILGERLTQDVVLPARSRGYHDIWLVGISLGGLGALAYVVRHPGQIARTLLLAPYLGESDWILPDADGDSTPGEEGGARPLVRQLWRWIGDHPQEQASRPEVYLGYGLHDRFAHMNGLFARHLPQRHVITAPGGHDWGTWRWLWGSFLAMWAEEPMH